MKAKHTFKVETIGNGFCGHEYCPGRCYSYKTTCSCGKIWHSKLSDDERTKHVLTAEGLMA